LQMTVAGMDLADPLYIGGAAQQRRSSGSERPQKERVTFVKKATHSQSSPAIGIAKVGLGYVRFAHIIMHGAANPRS
jgi:hypothetical protein